MRELFYFTRARRKAGVEVNQPKAKQIKEFDEIVFFRTGPEPLSEKKTAALLKVSRYRVQKVTKAHKKYNVGHYPTEAGPTPLPMLYWLRHLVVAADYVLSSFGNDLKSR